MKHTIQFNKTLKTVQTFQTSICNLCTLIINIGHRSLLIDYIKVVVIF